MARDVRIVIDRECLFVRARVVDAETGEMLAESDVFGSETAAIADARTMICDNEREVS